jgi:hypothetical protein
MAAKYSCGKPPGEKAVSISLPSPGKRPTSENKVFSRCFWSGCMLCVEAENPRWESLF